MQSSGAGSAPLAITARVCSVVLEAATFVSAQALSDCSSYLRAWSSRYVSRGTSPAAITSSIS